MNPRSYVTDELWKQAPVLKGSTKFEPLADAKNILVTGGAGFMYVTHIDETPMAFPSQLQRKRKSDRGAEHVGLSAT